MKEKKQIKQEVETWIAEEDTPTSASLKVLRPNHPDYGQTEDEIAERHQFIRWYLNQDLAPLMDIPVKRGERRPWLVECQVTDDRYSAFDTHDFRQTLPAFDKRAYAFDKLLERIEDLGIMHSVISFEEGRQNVQARYERLLEDRFRRRVDQLAKGLTVASDDERRRQIKRQIREIMIQIIACKKAWQKHAQAP